MMIDQAVSKSLTESICESCGANFSCGVNVGECWCFALNLEAETLTDLREKFARCLCENCLNKLRQPEPSEYEKI
ncbi:MAG: cysteine-rich CWC family protein [Acidobacteriota bacterium]|nr:cysteine-rich CWC family protein [Acidobacteriota bacterium]